MQLLADFMLVSGFTIIAVILFLLIVSRKRRLPQNILIGILSIIELIIITLYASLHQLEYLFLITNLFEDGARFIIGPLVYIYIKSIFVKDKRLLRNHWFHFLPFLGYWLVFSFPKAISGYNGEHLFDYLALFQGNAYLALIKDLFLLFYIFLSSRLFIKFKLAMKDSFSSFSLANFHWVKRFLFCFLLVTLFDLHLVMYHFFSAPSFRWDLGIFSMAFLIFVTSYLGYHGLRQSVISLPDFLLESNISKEQTGKKIPKFSNLSKEELQALKIRLEEVLVSEEPYLSQELTLSNLAERLNTTDKKLSTVLNQFMDVTFYDLINSYRVEAVKSKLALAEYHKYSLLGIAYSCGFNSKSSFYRAFKKETGVSPTTYKQTLLT